MTVLSSIIQSSVPASKTSLSAFDPKQKPWDVHGSEKDALEALFGSLSSDKTPTMGKYSRRMALCAQELLFALKGEAWKLDKAFFCKVRACPICQWRRTLKTTAILSERLPAILNAQGLIPLFLTLTVCSPKIEDLRETLRALTAGFQRLSQRQAWPAVGWLKTVEVTKGDIPGHCHPHMHILLLVTKNYFKNGYLSKNDWLRLWQEAMRDDTITQVDIRRVKLKKPGTDGLKAAICEIAKYATKPSDLISAGLHDSNWLIEYVRQVHKMRFLSSGGVLKGIFVDEEDPAGPEESEPKDPEGPVFYADWFAKKQRYFVR